MLSNKSKTDLTDFSIAMSVFSNPGDLSSIQNLIKNKNSIKINQINFKDRKNSIILKGAKFSKEFALNALPLN